ncbi:MAG: sigma factor [Clostridium sp.]|uniref:sigma factor n=1 Tax=Clostridium sp. TaxID=1506 RepID=UPI002FCB0B39
MTIQVSSLENHDINDLIKNHIPLIVKTISEVTGRYVSVENDEEFSIGLAAFVEAVEKYQEDKGVFTSFAKLVISSRIKNFLKKENRTCGNVSIEDLTEKGIDIGEEYKSPIEDKTILLGEIESFKKDLLEFNMTLEDLAEDAPRHEDTRKNAIGISKKVSRDEELTGFIFSKKRLPIKRISLKFTVTEKIIKGSKKFILSVVIVFYKNYRNIKLWIKG